MRLTINDPDNDQYVVLLNNKPIRAVAADDDEGWVDIVDLSAFAPPIAPVEESNVPGEGNDTAEWEQVPLKRIIGEVTIRKI